MNSATTASRSTTEPRDEQSVLPTGNARRAFTRSPLDSAASSRSSAESEPSASHCAASSGIS